MRSCPVLNRAQRPAGPVAGPWRQAASGWLGSLGTGPEPPFLDQRSQYSHEPNGNSLPLMWVFHRDQDSEAEPLPLPWVCRGTRSHSACRWVHSGDVKCPPRMRNCWQLFSQLHLTESHKSRQLPSAKEFCHRLSRLPHDQKSIIYHSVCSRLHEPLGCGTTCTCFCSARGPGDAPTALIPSLP